MLLVLLICFPSTIISYSCLRGISNPTIGVNPKLPFTVSTTNTSLYFSNSGYWTSRINSLTEFSAVIKQPIGADFGIMCQGEGNSTREYLFAVSSRTSRAGFSSLNSYVSNISSRQIRHFCKNVSFKSIRASYGETSPDSLYPLGIDKAIVKFDVLIAP